MARNYFHSRSTKAYFFFLLHLAPLVEKSIGLVQLFMEMASLFPEELGESQVDNNCIGWTMVQTQSRAPPASTDDDIDVSTRPRPIVSITIHKASRVTQKVIRYPSHKFKTVFLINEDVRLKG